MSHLTKLIAVCLLTAQCVIASSATSAMETAQLFVLHSYSQEYPWTKGQHQGFVESLQQVADTQFQIETEYLDTKRRRYEPDYAQRFAAFLQDKYAAYHPDAIYVSDDNALRFALDHLDSLFPDTPIFFSGVNDGSVLGRIKGRQVTGVFENKEIEPNLALLADMGKATSDIIVVGDGTSTYRAIERDIKLALKDFPRISADFLAGNRITEVLSVLREHEAGTLFLTTLGGMRDDDNRTLPLRDTIRRIVATRPRLVVSMEDVYIFDGVLGGYVTSGPRQGQAAAAQILDFLQSGALPAPVTKSPNTYLIDEHELVRHGLTLPPSVLPEITLINPLPSLYQRYRGLIIGALAVLSTLLVAMLMILLFTLSVKNREIRLRSKAFEEQAEIALRAKDSLNEAQRSARQGSWDWNLESNAFMWSDGLRHLCGDPEIPFGTSCDSFLLCLPAEDRSAFSEAIHEVRERGDSLELVHHIKQAGTDERTVRQTIRAIRDHGLTVERLIGTVQDITEQHQAEAQLRESEEKYRRLFELSEDPMWLIVGHCFVIANKAASRVLGYPSPNELIDVHPSKLSPEFQADGRASREKADEMMNLAFHNGYHRFEWQHRKRDGTEFPVEVSLTKVPYHGGVALFCVWRDISQIKATQQALEEKSAYLDGILASSEKVAIVGTDADGCIHYYNPTSEKIFGLSVDNALGSNLNDIHAALGIDPARYVERLEQAKTDGEFRFTMKLERDDGVHDIDARVSPIHRDDKAFAGYMLMCEDVTEQRRAAELVEYHATYDALTDLPNRRLFMDQLQQTIARARRHGHLSAVLFLDLDNFKTINDSLGHPVGDELLREVAHRLKSRLREEDTVARLGGDEFVLLLPELARDRDEAANGVRSLAEAIHQAIIAPYRLGPHELHVTTSIGISVFPADNETADDVLRQADTAMYRAKETGRNTIRFFLPSMQQEAENRLRLIGQLRNALPSSQLRVVFQPQFGADRDLIGAEVLLRWQHPDHGLVTPEHFITTAEEAGLVLDIGHWVMQEAFKQIHAWNAGKGSGRGAGRIAINISALQFRQPDFVNRIEGLLTETGADPHWVTLEMTESVLLEDISETVDKIKQLKGLGVHFSIDDFGTGYSSLSYLKRLPVDEIKIDRSFVRDVLQDTNDAALVDTILTMARHIGLNVVAEGVESEPVLEFLIDRGCRLFQGYLFGKPCDATTFEQRYLAPVVEH